MAENQNPANDKGRPAEILLVEDNPGDVILTKRTLAAVNFANNIAVAENADAAMIALQSRKFDIILLDINMPKKGGLSLLEEIKKDTTLAKTPVFMLTSSKAPTDLNASQNLDAHSYIVKPLTMEKLALALARLPNFWCTVMVQDKP